MSQTADARIRGQVARLVASPKHKAVTDYAMRLDDLLQVVAAHQASGGAKAGRRSGLYAVDRAALVVVTGHFQGFIADLFVEIWNRKYPNSSGETVLARLRFNNPWPADIDNLFDVVGHKAITKAAEKRKSASAAEPPKTLTQPAFVRARSRHQVRQVVAEMVRLRNATVHGGTSVNLKLSDVTSYLTETVTLAVRMSAAL